MSTKCESIVQKLVVNATTQIAQTMTPPRVTMASSLLNCQAGGSVPSGKPVVARLLQQAGVGAPKILQQASGTKILQQVGVGGGSAKILQQGTSAKILQQTGVGTPKILQQVGVGTAGAKILQQAGMVSSSSVTGGVVVTSTGLKQAQPGTTIRLQAEGSILQGGKPVAFQRAQSIESVKSITGSKVTPESAALLQRLQGQAQTIEVAKVVQSSVPLGDKVSSPTQSNNTVTTSPSSAHKPPTNVPTVRGGKPATLYITKPGATPGSKAIVQQISRGSETVAQLIQSQGKQVYALFWFMIK